MVGMGVLTIYVNGIKVDSGQTGGIQNQDDGDSGRLKQKLSLKRLSV